MYMKYTYIHYESGGGVDCLLKFMCDDITIRQIRHHDIIHHRMNHVSATSYMAHGHTVLDLIEGFLVRCPGLRCGVFPRVYLILMTTS